MITPVVQHNCHSDSTPPRLAICFSFCKIFCEVDDADYDNENDSSYGPEISVAVTALIYF